MKIKICKFCSKEFETNISKKIFCSNNCKITYHIKNKKKNTFNCVCENCNKEFVKEICGKKLPSKVFCSISCYSKYKNRVGTGKIKECLECGNSFNQKNKAHKYCSKTCKEKYNFRLRDKQIVKCSFCGHELKRAKHLKNENYFCGQKCESSFRIQEARDFRKCVICGKEFTCRRSDDLILCSTKCQAKWQSINRRGENSPTYKHHIPAHKRRKKCKVCGDYFYGSPKYILERIYCSVGCKNKGIGMSMTKPHQEVCSMLEAIGVKYEVEHSFKRYSFDCYIGDGLAIEVMGDYYHANPMFPDKYVQRWRAIRRKDMRKDNVVRASGFSVLYLWESDIAASPDLCLELIRLYISNDGCMDDYHSFNYSIVNGLPTINEKIIPFNTHC